MTLPEARSASHAVGQRQALELDHRTPYTVGLRPIGLTRAFIIEASDVSLDLNGFTVYGGGANQQDAIGACLRFSRSQRPSMSP